MQRQRAFRLRYKPARFMMTLAAQGIHFQMAKPPPMANGTTTILDMAALEYPTKYLYNNQLHLQQLALHTQYLPQALAAITITSYQLTCEQTSSLEQAA